MVLYPAIDLLGGKCVRLTEGDYNLVKQYDDFPTEVAKRFADQGATHLHVVDLDGAKQGHPVNLQSVSDILNAAPLKVQVGGGIRTLEAARQWLDAGADRVVMGTALTQDRKVTQHLFDLLGERLVAGVDTRNGKVAVSGWLDVSDLDGEEFVRDLSSMGCMHVVFTDIARDGKLLGPNLIETRKMIEAAPGIEIVASGGVSSLDDLAQLKQIGCPAAIVGKALYEGRFTLAEALRVVAG